MTIPMSQNPTQSPLDEEALDHAAREGYAVRCKTNGPRTLAKYASDDIMEKQLADARVIVRAYLVSQEAAAPSEEPVAWCQPMDCGKHTQRKFIVRFEDADKGDAIFDDEAEARDYWERANGNWNCYLFGALPRVASPAVAPVASSEEPVAYASAGQLNGFEDRPGDEGGVYIPLRKTPLGQFQMPLYSAPVAPVAVSVKPLQWRDHSFKESMLHTAEMPYGQYSITYDSDCEYPFVVRPFVTKQSNYETLEDAKADCEIDYRERIVSSIIPATKGGEVAVEALTDAEDTLCLVEQPSFRDPRHGDEIEALGLRIGFGALMSSASASWRAHLAADGYPVGGEFVAGPCHGTVLSTLSKIRKALAALSAQDADGVAKP